MPFPYVDADKLERELQLTPERIGVSDTEWQELLSDALEGATERVETDEYAGVQFRDSETTDDVPGIIREGIIRLARARLYAIETDGLESENTGDSASYNYRSLADVRAEVKSDLQAADISRGDDEGGHDDVRVSLL